MKLELLRRRKLLERLDSVDFLSSSDVANLGGVSVVTARRDIRSLARAGLLREVKGGASSIRAADRAFDSAGALAAAAASRLVAGGSVIGLVGTSVVSQLAADLSKLSDVAIVTNSIAVEKEVRHATALEFTIVGGELSPRGEFRGPIALAALAGLHVDALFFEACLVHGGTVLAVAGVEEAELCHAFMAVSDRTVVLVQPSSFPTQGRIGPIELADALVFTDGTVRQQKGLILGSVRVLNDA